MVETSLPKLTAWSLRQNSTQMKFLIRSEMDTSVLDGASHSDGILAQILGSKLAQARREVEFAHRLQMAGSTRRDILLRTRLCSNAVDLV